MFDVEETLACHPQLQTRYHCGQVGHISRVCCSKQQGKQKQPPETPLNTQVHTVEDSESDEFGDVLGSIKIHKQKGNRWKWNWTRGSSVLIVPHDLHREKFNDKPLYKANSWWKPPPVGVLNANVEYKDQPPLLLDLYVFENKGPVLMGRGWLHDIPLDWYAIKSMGVSQAPTIGRECPQTMLNKCDLICDKGYCIKVNWGNGVLTRFNAWLKQQP